MEKKLGKTAIPSIITGLAVLITISSEAHAYFDPGTGALLIQGAIGFGLYLLVNVKKTYKKLSSLFSRSEP